MNIAASSLQLGPYTVQQRQEPDRQWPLWWVFLGTVLIGKSFSRPCESDCVWLYRQQLQQTVYAFSSTPIAHRWAAKQRKWINPPGHNRHLSQRKKQA